MSSKDLEKPAQNESHNEASSNESQPVGKAQTTTEQMSTARTVLISFVIIFCQFVQMIPYGSTISAALDIGEDLGVSQDQAVWIAAAYPLTQGAFVLMGGRVGAVYGHKNTAVVSGAWWVFFHIMSGLTHDLKSLAAMRAMSGIGGGFMVPNLVALLTITFPPGRTRNITVGLFGAIAPIGSAGGTVFPGFFTQLEPWKWLFFFLALIGAVVFTLFAFVMPGEPEPLDKNGKIDYIGAYFGVAGLILFNVVWNQAPAVGWDTPYVYALLIVAFIHFGLFVLWESKFAKEPICSVSIFTAPSFSMMIISVFISFMAVGINNWYVVLWLIKVRNYTLFSNAAAWSPMVIGGAVAAVLSAKSIRYIPSQYIMSIGAICTCAALILTATMPAQQIYWAQVFPAMIFLSFGPDFLFAAAQITASNTVKRKDQGVAGSFIGTIQAYGLSTGLGFAGTVEAYTNNGGTTLADVVKGYRHALYLGIGMAGAALFIALAFVRIPKDRREGWDEDDVPEPPKSEEEKS